MIAVLAVETCTPPPEFPATYSDRTVELALQAVAMVLARAGVWGMQGMDVSPSLEALISRRVPRRVPLTSGRRNVLDHAD